MDINHKIFLTFDMDWACDELMDFLYDLLEEYGLAATIHITNPFKSLDKYKENGRIELRIHPNFNVLVDGNSGGVNDKTHVLRRCKQMIPDAVVARSHALLNSTPITKEFFDCGIRYELNYFIDPYKGINLYPWLFQGVLQIPFFYEDDLYLLEKKDHSPAFYLDRDIRMYKVFNFHPIHLYLNCESLDRYRRMKEHYHDFSVLKQNVNVNRYGILDFFKELVETAREMNFEFGKIVEIGEWG